MQHSPLLIVIFPLLGALICPIVSYFNRVAGRVIVSLCSLVSVGLAMIQLNQIVNEGEIHYWFGGYKPPYGIEFSIDSLSGVILVLITIIGFLSTLYSMPFYKKASRFRSSGYFSMLSLLICGLLGMTSTGDVFNLYVFLEITSLAGYGLIAMGGDKGVLSAFRYLLIGTIGASFYLLGIAFIYGETGTLNMYDMSGLVGPVLSSGTTMIAMIFFVIGFGIKMALFPLHGWQPDAYTNAHPGAAPLISGVMGKIPAYAMMRFFFYVFNANTESVSRFLMVVGVMSCMGMIYGSLLAIRQKDIRKMLAYSSIAQMGYIGMGISITGYNGLIGAVLHIIGHSCMKSCLFFCAGAIRYKYGETAMDNMGQIYKKMPKTSISMVVAALSMVGLPPFVGFFSKWYLALGAIEKDLKVYVVFLIISSLLNAVYFFRLIERMFMNKEVDKDEINAFPLKYDEDGQLIRGKASHFELPMAMLIPVMVTGIAIVLLGIFNTPLVQILSSSISEVAL